MHWKVKRQMRIGELASRSGVAAKTIRYYEDIGLVPLPRRSPSGYRDYGESAVDRLAFIRASQAAGLTLGQIRSILALRDVGETPCGHVANLLQSRAAELNRRIGELTALRAELQRLAARAEHLDPADCDPDGICHIIRPGR